MPTPKPVSGTELMARVLVLEALVIALVRHNKGLPLIGLREEVMKTVESFGRPDLVTETNIYANEISKALADAKS
jgi:hypothetical protein